MDREDLSYRLSREIVSLVRKKNYIFRYGLKSCNDLLYSGDLHDLYLTKLLVDSDIDCDNVIKTNENATNKILS